MKMQQQAFTYLISLLQNQHQQKLPSIYIVIESYAEVVFDVCADNEVWRYVMKKSRVQTAPKW